MVLIIRDKMDKKISLASSLFTRYYSVKDALTQIKKAGADAVDLNLSSGRYDVDNPNSIYSKSEDEFCTFFTELKGTQMILSLR